MDDPGPRTTATAAALAARATAFVTEATNPPPPRHRWLRRGRFDLVEIADAVTALICFLVANGALRGPHSSPGHAYLGPGTAALVAFVTSAPLLLRTRAPLTAWTASALAVAGTAIAVPDGPVHPGALFPPTSLLVYGMCLYAVTVRCVPRIVVAVASATVLAAVVLQPATAAAALFLIAIPLLLGAVVRTRRSGTRRLAEQEQRHSGERAVLEERQRIARELHDVVAHHMSVIAIQAEAAPYKTADPPAELVESFGEIRQSALTGLTELRRLLGVLRADGVTTAPQPGLAELDALLESARGGSLTVSLRITGDRIALPDGVDLSAYRILQEALSNAMRYAPRARVDVRVEYQDDRLRLEVSDDGGEGGGGAADGEGGVTPGGADGSRGGHGIIGMRERAAMLGGTLVAAARPGGGFLVMADLPVRPGVPEVPGVPEAPGVPEER